MAAWCMRLAGEPVLVAGQGGHREAAAVPLARKDAALLAYAVLHAPCPSAQMAQLLWPEAGARGALNNARQRLHRLRKATGGRLLEMSDTLAVADDLQHDTGEDPGALQQDPAAWDAELLAGCEYPELGEFSAWLSATRQDKSRRRREALAGITSQAEAAGELVRALRYAQRLLADDSLSEHAHRRLMRLHYLRGDIAAAVAAFEHCEQTLKAELGLRPSVETVQLLNTIEQGRAAVPSALRPVPASLSRPPRLVGRDDALLQLRAAERDGLLPVLVAEAGMGKTRLLQELLAGREDAVHVQARPGDAAVPYAAVGRLIRAVVKGFDLSAADSAALEALDASAGLEVADATPHQLRAALAACLQAARRRGLRLLAADDLHFADAASLEALLALMQSEELPDLRWVLAHRPLAEGSVEAGLLEPLRESAQVRWLELSPLDEAQLREFVVSLDLAGFELPGVVAALARRTGGNPLFVIETLRASLAAGWVADGTSALPRTLALEHLIEQRLRRLSKPALALARVVAIATPDFSIELAEHVLATPALALADAWHELEGAQVLRGEAFAHDLVLDAALRATPQAVARRAHRSIAAFLDLHRGEPARVARHWALGGEAQRAAEAFVRAAARAAQASRPREQAELLLAAAEQWGQAGRPEQALLAQAEAAEPLILADGVTRPLELTERLVSGALPAAVAGRVWTVRASVLVWAARWREAVTAAREALAALPVTDLDDRVGAECALAIALSNQGQADEALTVLLPAWQRFEHLVDDDTRDAVCGAMAILMAHLQRNAEGTEVAERQYELACRRGGNASQLNALLSVGFFALRYGDMDKVIRSGERIRQLGAGSQELQSMALRGDVLLGQAYVAMGRYGEGIGTLERAVEEAERASEGSLMVEVGRVHLADAFVQLGRPEIAKRLLQKMSAQAISLNTEASRQLTLARVLELQGDPAAAQAWSAAAVRGERSTALPALLALLRQGVAAGRAGWALVTEVLEHAASTDQPGVGAAARAARLDLAVAHALVAPEQLASWAAEAERLVHSHRATMVYLPSLLLSVGRAFAHLQLHEAAWRCFGRAAWWVHAAAWPHVPALFRASFLDRNPANVALRRELVMQRSRAGATGPLAQDAAAIEAFQALASATADESDAGVH